MLKFLTKSRDIDRRERRTARPRRADSPSPSATRCSARRCAALPRGDRGRPASALGCFWGAERLFWELHGVYTTAVGYAGGFTPNPTYDEVCSGQDRPHRGRAGRLRPGEGLATSRSCAAFWEGHDPTQGMRQGNDVGTQYRSAIYCDDRRAARRPPSARATRYQSGSARARPRPDHDRDRPGRPVLLRRGLPPAVPAQDPERLLRPRRHRREPARSAPASAPRRTPRPAAGA